MGARIPTNVNTGEAAKKGAAVQAAGDDPAPRSSHPNKANVDPGSQFEPVDFAGVGSSRKGASLSDRGSRSAPVSMPGSKPLAGHLFSAYPTKGNSPKRGPGKSSPSADEMVRSGRD